MLWPDWPFVRHSIQKSTGTKSTKEPDLILPISGTLWMVIWLVCQRRKLLICNGNTWNPVWCRLLFCSRPAEIWLWHLSCEDAGLWWNLRHTTSIVRPQKKTWRQVIVMSIQYMTGTDLQRSRGIWCHERWSRQQTRAEPWAVWTRGTLDHAFLPANSGARREKYWAKTQLRQVFGRFRVYILNVHFEWVGKCYFHYSWCGW